MNWSENKSKFYFLIIVILIIVILLQKSCGGGKVTVPKNDTITVTNTSYATITKYVPTYVPKWSVKKEYIHDTTKLIDTAYVVGDYYSTYFYKDSLISDTLHLYVNDSISQNKIQSRSLKYTLKFPTVTVTNTVIKNKNEFYIGLGLVGSKTGINFFGPELMLRTKSKSVYGLGVGINGSFEPQLSLRVYWKIGKK
jgi:hypothetical protein